MGMTNSIQQPWLPVAEYATPAKTPSLEVFIKAELTKKQE